MTSMRYRDIAARGRDEHKRDQDANRRLARIAVAGRRLPALQTAAIPNDARSIRTKRTAPRTQRVLKRVRALGRMRPLGRDGR